MKKFLPHSLIVLISILFFYQTIFFFRIPFPGDLLIAEYFPWRYFPFEGYGSGGLPHKAQYFDVITQLYPWKSFVIESLRDGILPLWNPYNFSGHPLLANFQSSVFYPLNILYLLMDQRVAWGLSVVVQPFLAVLFTFLYLRRIKLSMFPSIFGGVAYGFSLYMSVFLEYNTIGHTISYLPLILYSIENLSEKIDKKAVLVFVVSILLALFSGHIQVFGFIAIFSFIYAVLRLKNLKKILNIFALLVLVLGIGAIQLFPTIELIQESARVSQDYNFLLNTLLLQPSQLILFMSPDFFGNPVTRNYLINDTYPTNAIYIGVLPLILAFFSLFDLKNFYKKFFASAFLILILVLTNNPISALLYKLEIPLFSTGSPSNSIFLISFSLAVLSAFGLEKLSGKDKVKFYQLMIVPVIIFLSFALLILKVISGNTNQFILSVGITIIFIVFIAAIKFLPKSKKILSQVFILILCFDLFYYFVKFNPFVPLFTVYPENEIATYLRLNPENDRVWGLESANIASNIGTYIKIPSPEGYDPLYPKFYGEFIYSSRNGKLLEEFDNTTRSDARIAPFINRQEFQENTYRAKVLNILGVKYVISKDSSLDDKNYNLLLDKEGIKVYQNSQSLPRVFLADNFIVYRNNSEFEKTFFNKNFNPSTTILLTESPPGFIGDDSSNKESRIKSYKQNSIEITAGSDSDKLLFISDTYFPGWKAYIDGKETKIYRANHAFRSVVLPKGKHNVEFAYQPESLSFGIKTSIICLMLLFGLIFISRKHAK